MISFTEEELQKIGIGIGLNVPVDRPDWERYYLNLCDVIATKSPDSNTKFGAVFIRDKRLIACGFNGFPAGSPDNLLPNSRDPQKWKYRYVVHAEENAIYYAARYGIPLEGCTLIVQGHPCSECCKKLISVGVKDWIVGSRTHQVDETELLLMKFWTETYGIRIKRVDYK